MEIEKSRGISILSSQMKFHYHSRKINIVDTSGHADFISEVERSLLAVNLVLLVIMAYEGVQSQTRNIWEVFISGWCKQRTREIPERSRKSQFVG
mgnify:CR=1 FL=1